MPTVHHRKMRLRSYQVSEEFRPFYNGGPAFVDERFLYCAHEQVVKIVNISNGKVVGQVDLEGSDASAILVSFPNLFVASRNLLIRQFSVHVDNDKTPQLIRSWKSFHRIPSNRLASDGELLASAGVDIKVFDTERRYCTHSFRGVGGLVSCLRFCHVNDNLRLVSASDDYCIRVFCLETSAQLAKLPGHFSTITDFYFEKEFLFSAGRDQVVIQWNLAKLEKTSTIPVYKEVELFCPIDGCQKMGLVTSTGVVMFWDLPKAKLLQSGAANDGSVRLPVDESIQFLFYVKSAIYICSGGVLCIADINEQNVVTRRQIVTDFDQPTDAVFLTGGKQVLLTTNSPNVVVLDRNDGSSRLTRCHNDTILCVDCKFLASSKGSGPGSTIVATGSKDNNVAVMKYNCRGQFRRLAVGCGHTGSVMGVAISSDLNSLATCGSDLTVKVWMLGRRVLSAKGRKSVHDLAENDGGEEPAKLACSLTEFAHKKGVNCVRFSPNDKFLATGGADRRVKVWTADQLQLAATFEGHKKGIWDVAFSPVDKALASASADATLKIWSLTDQSCFRTFDGHTSSVTRLLFTPNGMHLASVANDGLLKLWSVRSGESNSFEAHDSRIWCLALVPNAAVSEHKSDDELSSTATLLTAGDDGCVKIWTDTTDEQTEMFYQSKEADVERETQLENFFHDGRWSECLKLAVLLDRPARCLAIVERIPADQLPSVVRENFVEPDAIKSLVGLIKRWNTNSRTSCQAQMLFNCLLKSCSTEQLVAALDRPTIESLLSYTERHLKRWRTMRQNSHFVGYISAVTRHGQLSDDF